MSQNDYIKDIAKYGLENDRVRLMSVLNELIEHSKKNRKLNFAIQLQSILKESLDNQKFSQLTTVGSRTHLNQFQEKELSDLILEKITSDYSMEHIIANKEVHDNLNFFIKEHQKIKILQNYGLPVSNKLLLHGPSGCGKTLAAYIVAGELNKMMMVINLGAIVSSKLGDTSKNLSRLFKKAAQEDCIIFLDEFDSLGKIRDYDQDHGEMKRVVNTLLQLFDYLPQTTILIAATNQKDMIDSALTRRFDNIISFSLPDEKEIRKLISLILKNGAFQFDDEDAARRIFKKCKGLSYFSIQKTLVTAVKRSLLTTNNLEIQLGLRINTKIWLHLVEMEKQSLNLQTANI